MRYAMRLSSIGNDSSACVVMLTVLQRTAIESHSSIDTSSEVEECPQSGETQHCGAGESGHQAWLKCQEDHCGILLRAQRDLHQSQEGEERRGPQVGSQASPHHRSSLGCHHSCFPGAIPQVSLLLSNRCDMCRNGSVLGLQLDIMPASIKGLLWALVAVLLLASFRVNIK